MQQNHSTQDSRVVPHRGTNWAALRLTAQIGRDAVLSKSYGRGYTSVFQYFIAEITQLRLRNRNPHRSRSCNLECARLLGGWSEWRPLPNLECGGANDSTVEARTSVGDGITSVAPPVYRWVCAPSFVYLRPAPTSRPLSPVTVPSDLNFLFPTIQMETLVPLVPS